MKRYAFVWAGLLFAQLGTAAFAQNTFPASGNVGIGTSSPQVKLDVVGNMQINSGNESRLVWTGNTYLYTQPIASSRIRMGVWDSSLGARDLVLQDAGGAVGIGMNSPSGYGRLAVAGVITEVSPDVGTLGTIQSDNSGLTSIGSWRIAADAQIRFNTGNAQGLFTEKMRIDQSGNVGIGTSAPTAPLHIVGANAYPHLSVAAAASAPFGAVLNIDATATSGGKSWFVFSSGGSAGEGTGKLIFKNQTDGTYPLTLSAAGNVGVWTTNPTYPLSVNGTVRAKEVIVDTGWSDYVFAADYKLAPLSEVEQQIKADKHLPGIPSAHDVAEKGISVGEMQAKLLGKIEELTLHQIEQEKAINELRTENRALRNAMANTTIN